MYCARRGVRRSAHDDVIKWKHFPRYWPFVWGIHRSPVNSPHKGQWHGALMFSLICAWINSWVNNREAGDLGRHRAHYVVIVMKPWVILFLAGSCSHVPNSLWMVWQVFGTWNPSPSSVARHPYKNLQLILIKCLRTLNSDSDYCR